jgi:mitochondrial fission protein ELM1
MGHRAGDNGQLLALAQALGWPFEIKRFVYRRLEFIFNMPLGATLAGRNASRSSPLTPPWPDLVITAGRRNDPIARWIQKHADKPVRLVHVGRPWAPPACFDLIVSSAEFSLPDDPNVLRNALPLPCAIESTPAATISRWGARFAALPQPRIAVLVGGSSELFTFGRRAATQLGRAASAMAAEASGSLLVTTSARTAPRAADMLRTAITVPSEFFRWHPGAQDNPYAAVLALADAFIVTGDSVTMLAEACLTGKPVYIFDPGGETGRSSQALLRFLSDPCAFLYRQLLTLDSRRLDRDIRRVHQAMIAAGRAVRLGERFSVQTTLAPPDELARAVARTRALFEPAKGA